MKNSTKRLLRQFDAESMEKNQVIIMLNQLKRKKEGK